MSDSKEANTPSNTSAKKQTPARKKKVNSKPETAAKNPVNKAAEKQSATTSKTVTKKTATNTNKKSSTKKSGTTESTNKTTMQKTMSASNNQSASVEQAPVKSSGKGLSLFSLLLSLIALGGAGYTWYQMQVEQVQSSSNLAVGVTEIGGQVSRLSDTINLVKSRQDDIVSKQDLDSEMRAATQALDTKLAPVISQQKNLEESLIKISDDLQQGENQYVLNEVTQLLKLANHNVNFSQNVESAVAALKLADGQLKDLSDPRYAAVRKEINTEISALLSAGSVDVEALSAQLNTLAEIIPDLPLANEPEVAIENIASQNPANSEVESTTWRTELRKVWNDILSSVQVQRVDQPPKPLLVPEQRYFLNQNIQLSLSKAELALLQGSPAIYQQSIKSSTQWLSEYFDTNNEEVHSVIQQLTDLQNQKVAIDLPEITGSFDTLQTIKAR